MRFAQMRDPKEKEETAGEVIEGTEEETTNEDSEDTEDEG